MRLLLAVCLCFISTRQAFGDENFKRVEDPIDDVQTPGAPISAPVPDPITAPTDDDFRPARRPAVDLGPDPPGLEKGAKAEATEWHPRLLILLNANVVQIKVPVIKNTIPELKSPFASSSDNGDSPAISPPSDLPESGESVKHITAFRVQAGDYFSLYCDAVTLNSLQEGTTPTYQLECKSRVHISTEGFSVDADSASFKEGKCELVNAKLNNGVVSATAPQLTLTIPIHAVSTAPYCRPIPKSQPTEKAVTRLPAKSDDSDSDLPAFRSPQQPPSTAKKESFFGVGGMPEPNN